MRSLHYILLTGCFAMLMIGCRASPVGAPAEDGRWLENPPGPGLVARNDSPIPDVPMPVGFVGIGDRSSATMSGGVRVVTHVYQGRSTILDAVRFYERWMPLKGWTYVASDAIDRTALLQYTKGRERLTINLVDMPRYIEVQVNINARDAALPMTGTSATGAGTTTPRSSGGPLRATEIRYGTR